MDEVSRSRRLVHCACGWSGRPRWSVAGVDSQWERHIVAARSQAIRSEARAVCVAAAARSAELARTSAEARARRVQLQERRLTLQVQLDRRRSTTALLSHSTHLLEESGLLERARVMAGLSIDQLWIGYWALGGNGTCDQVSSWLQERTPISAHDHDVLVVVLNERFADAGLGQPLDCWGAA